MDAPVTSKLYKVLSVFDVFNIWGAIVLAIGLVALCRISKGSAYAMVVVFLLIVAGIVFLVTPGV